MSNGHLGSAKAPEWLSKPRIIAQPKSFNLSKTIPRIIIFCYAITKKKKVQEGKGKGRREKGVGRREKGEGRREKGVGRREKGEGRRA